MFGVILVLVRFDLKFSFNQYFSALFQKLCRTFRKTSVSHNGHESG
jgi:hypothetical protein